VIDYIKKFLGFNKPVVTALDEPSYYICTFDSLNWEAGAWNYYTSGISWPYFLNSQKNLPILIKIDSTMCLISRSDCWQYRNSFGAHPFQILCSKCRKITENQYKATLALWEVRP
jgi:hypothetical protein